MFSFFEQVVYNSDVVTYMGGLTVAGGYLYWMDSSVGVYRIAANSTNSDKKELLFEKAGFFPSIAFYNASASPGWFKVHFSFSQV